MDVMTILKKTREILVERGGGKHILIGRDRRVCMRGALHLAIGGEDTADARCFIGEGVHPDHGRLASLAESYISRELDGRPVTWWNDLPSTSQSDMIDVVDRTIVSVSKRAGQIAVELCQAKADE